MAAVPLFSAIFLLIVHGFQNIHALCVDWVELLVVSDDFWADHYTI